MPKCCWSNATHILASKDVLQVGGYVSLLQTVPSEPDPHGLVDPPMSGIPCEKIWSTDPHFCNFNVTQNPVTSLAALLHVLMSLRRFTSLHRAVRVHVMVSAGVRAGPGNLCGRRNPTTQIPIHTHAFYKHINVQSHFSCSCTLTHTWLPVNGSSVCLGGAEARQLMFGKRSDGNSQMELGIKYD